jgi:4-alpha-glucanotransferase
VTYPRVGVAAQSYIDQAGRSVQVDPEVVAAVQSVAGDPVPVADGAAPEPLPPQAERRWGWQIQLYQLRGSQSWGIGDYADLAALATGLGRHGAQVLLVNPLHAETPVAPWSDSPYYPSSRRFSHQLSVSISALPEFAAAPEPVRQAVAALRPPTEGLVDRPAVWAAKLAAFELLVPRRFDADAAAQAQPDGAELLRFAQFCGSGRPGSGGAARVGPGARPRAARRRAGRRARSGDERRHRPRPGGGRRPGRR